MKKPQDTQAPADPALWAQFAAAAMQALVAKQPSDGMRGEAYRLRFEETADEAAKYADALSREWAKRFLVIMGDVVKGGK